MTVLGWIADGLVTGAPLDAMLEDSGLSGQTGNGPSPAARVADHA
jgi:hypothetical protein